jgi:murein L,D-transpeptidase YcbB/YkuD
VAVSYKTASLTRSRLVERNVRPDSRNLDRCFLAKGIALAALVLGANAVAAEGQTAAPAEPARHSLLAPETLPSFGDVAASPLLAVFNAPYLAAVEAFDPAAQIRLTPADAEAGTTPALALTSTASGAPSASSTVAETPPPPPIPGRSGGAPPGPVPTAIAAALARLIAHDGRNPLGDGDWRGARAAIGAFYADRQFAPLWVDENGLTIAGRAVLTQLERAADDGLNLSAFPLPRRLEGRLSPIDLAEAETTIAEAVVAYAEQASGSRITPTRVSPLVTAQPSIADPGAALAEIASARDPAQRLADFNPPQKGYRALREELRRLTDAGSGHGQKQGAGALAADALDDPPLVDNDAEAPHPLLKTARGRVRGLVRNAAYVASVDRAKPRRRAAILANMEMWRWEPREMGERRIEVNVPDFTVAMLDGDATVHSARVVVGKPDTPTPIFSNVMRYVLINPSWQVPDSIIRKEMLPRLASDPRYLSRRGYEVKTVGGRLVVRQPPGEDNALGRIAFMFPNDHAVYLHDTPSQSLFDSDMRALSHGCVRVEDPLRLAELVLGWPEERINAAIGGPERTVFLPRPVPIHIEYFTEFVDEYGELQERPDVYGLAQKVANILSSVRQD